MLKNKCETTTKIFSAEGHSRMVTWQNVDIEMLILSTASYNDDDYDVLYQKDGGRSSICRTMSAQSLSAMEMCSSRKVLSAVPANLMGVLCGLEQHEEMQGFLLPSVACKPAVHLHDACG